MKKTFRLWLILGSMMLVLLAGLLTLPAFAAPDPQYTPIASPTPGPDGRIIYIVQEGDTLWRISAITGVSLDELRRLNNLAEDDVIKPGDHLLLGLGGPANIPSTEGPPPTPTSDLPTPTPLIGTGMLCISVFLDTNGDGLRQEEELDLEGSAINISNRSGTVSLSQGEDNGLVPRCYEDVTAGFDDIPGTREECISIVQCVMVLDQGEYNISVGIPDGYNATTALNYATTLNAGDRTYLDFGAQPNSETVAEAPIIPESSDEKSPVLAFVGIGLLVVGIALGILAFTMRK